MNLIMSGRVLKNGLKLNVLSISSQQPSSQPCSPKNSNFFPTWASLEVLSLTIDDIPILFVENLPGQPTSGDAIMVQEIPGDNEN